MTANTPEELAGAFASAFNNQDLQALTNLFAADAAFMPQPDTVVSGDSIAPALQEFLALNGPIDLAVRRTIVAGDTALIIADWRVEGVGVDPTGNPIYVAGTSADVARRAADGTWRYLIDNPFGTV